MSRDKFSIDVPAPQLTLITNGNGNGNLHSPNPLKTPTARRLANFSREGILGSAQKARNLSQSSGDRESITNGLHNRQNGNGNGNGTSDDGINPLKRRSTDAGIDYPRRRATIAVSTLGLICFAKAELPSAKYAVQGSHGVMEQNQSASFALSLGPNAFTESRVSNSTLVTS